MFRKKSTSAGSAKGRLRLVLIQDRTNLSALDLDQLKNEILEVLARYVDIDRRAVNISMEQDGREQRLRADIPLKAATRANRR